MYPWDIRNRLTEVDPIVGSVTTGSLDDDNSPILDFNSSGAQTARYLQGLSSAGVDAVLARETSGSVVA